MTRTFIEVPLFTKNVYSKNEQDDLTEEEKKAFKAVIKVLKEE